MSKCLKGMTEKAKVDLDKELASSAGKESTCNAGDPGSIPGSGRSSGEGIGYPLQYSWASLAAQLVKSQPAMQETWIRSPGWEDPPGEGNGYPVHYSGLENSVDRGAWWATVHGVTESDMTERLSHRYLKAQMGL